VLKLNCFICLCFWHFCFQLLCAGWKRSKEALSEYWYDQIWNEKRKHAPIDTSFCVHFQHDGELYSLIKWQRLWAWYKFYMYLPWFKNARKSKNLCKFFSLNPLTRILLQLFIISFLRSSLSMTHTQKLMLNWDDCCNSHKHI